MADILKSYILKAPLQIVYEKWIANETIIPPAIKIDITPETGGKYILISQFGEDKWVMEGIFKEVIPYKKLVYTWEWNQDGKVTQVTVNFSEKEKTTHIDINHQGFEDEQSLAMHATGWDSYLASFENLLLA